MALTLAEMKELDAIQDRVAWLVNERALDLYWAELLARREEDAGVNTLDGLPL